jgi:hypothetical protein
LPERQRSALVLRELSGLSHHEIAQALQTSVGTAKQTIFEARRSLAEFEAGREMSCQEVCRTISDRDRRMLRARRIRAHLRGCRSCAAFADAIPARSADLRALAPLLPPAAAALLRRAMGGGVTGGSAGGGGSAGVAGAGTAGKAVLGLAAAKSGAAALAVVTAAVGATAVLAPPSRPHPGLTLGGPARHTAGRPTQPRAHPASSPRLEPYPATRTAARSPHRSGTALRASATGLARTGSVQAGGVDRASSRGAARQSGSRSARAAGRAGSVPRAAGRSAVSHPSGAGPSRGLGGAPGQAKRSTGVTGAAHSNGVRARGNGSSLAAERKSARDST